MYFTNVANIEELKKQYRRLCFIYHPDRGGNDDIMKAINNEYDELFSSLKNKKAYGNNEHNINDGYRDIINKIINLPIDIEICGSWIWVSGNTYPYRKQLKQAGFQWANKKRMWYWRPADQAVRRRKKTLSMSQIRDKYGSERIQSNSLKKLQAV